MITIFKETDNQLSLNLNLQEANLTNADEFKTEVMSLFDQHQKTIILNLNQVKYIDSSFLGALVAILKYVIPFQKDLILVGLYKDVADLFKLIRLDKVFKIFTEFKDVPLT